MIFTFLGIIIIIIASYIYDKELYNKKNIHTAVFLMLLGLFFQALHRVYEEYLLQKIETSTYRFVGLEGLFGLIFVIPFQLLFFLAYNNDHLSNDAKNFISNFNFGKSIYYIVNSKIIFLYKKLLIKYLPL